MPQSATWVNTNNYKLFVRNPLESNISFPSRSYYQALQDALTTIDSGDITELETIFNRPMECGHYFSFVSRTYFNPNTPQIGYTVPAEHFISIRPLLEWVILERPKDFIEIIDKIIQSTTKLVMRCY